MKKIGIVALGLFVACTLSGTCFAHAAVGIDDENIGYISGTVGTTSGTPVTVTVARGGDNSYLYWNEATTDEGGAYSFRFAFVETDNSGEYTVTVADMQGGTTTETLLFVNTADEETITTALSGAEKTTVLEKLGTVDDKLGIHLSEGSDFAAISESGRENVLTAMCGRQFTSADEVRAQFNGAVATEIMNSAEAAEVPQLLAAYASDLGLDIGEGSFFSDITDTTALATLYDLLAGKGYQSREALAAAFGKHVDLAAINAVAKSNRERCAELIHDIAANNYAEMNMTRFAGNAVGELQKMNLIDAIIAGKPYASLDDFADAFAKADKKYLQTVRQSDKGGTGGGTTVTSTLPEKEELDIIHPAEPVTIKGFTDLGAVVWAKESIERLYTKGIINGVGNNLFAPDAFVTREQFVKMLVGALDLKAVTSVSYTDVDKASVFYPYITTATAAGIVQGMDDGRFGMGMQITREDMAVMICRAISKLTLQEERAYTPFTDEAEIAPYAQEAVTTLYKYGIISGMGDGTFAPRAFTTRAQAAKLLDALLEKEAVA